MPLKILFVDDDTNLLQSISRMLTIERGDIIFKTALSADEAIKILENNKFDVLVADHKMAGMDGLTLLSLIRSKFPEIKRVMLSAQVNKDIVKEAESLAHLYISKPCDSEIIIAKIEKLIKE
jgi:DNA-binding NtrC family response regulator